MITALDVAYQGDVAVAAAVCFRNWASDALVSEHTAQIDGVMPYQPGDFYRRELPCLLKVITRIPHQVDVFVVDGFVWLGGDRTPGVGYRLWHALGEATPVVGVAKTAFRGTPEDAALLRGTSKKPLYVTAVGIESAEAKRLVSSMHGDNRFPTMLRRVDSLCTNGF